MADATIRTARARLGGQTTAARHDPRQYTQAAREAFDARFIREVDPSGELRATDPAEAERRALAARRLYFGRLALASLKARARKKNAAQGTNPGGAEEEVGDAAPEQLRP